MHKAIYGPSGNVIGAVERVDGVDVLHINQHDCAEFNQQQMDMLREQERLWRAACGDLRIIQVVGSPNGRRWTLWHPNFIDGTVDGWMLRAQRLATGICEIQATPEGWDDNARTWPVFCGALRMAPEAVS